MDTKVVWKQKMSFIGESNYGFKIPLGTSIESGGDNDGFRPLELLLIGLAGCTAMDVISILEKKRQSIQGFEISVHAERAEEHPRVFTSVVMEYLFKGHQVDRTAVQRSIELSTSKYCSAYAMLKKSTPIEVKITIQEV